VWAGPAFVTNWVEAMFELGPVRPGGSPVIKTQSMNLLTDPPKSARMRWWIVVLGR
jgi:hypothetical protein